MSTTEKKAIKPIQRLEINKEVYCRDITINNIYINHIAEYHKGYFKALLDISNVIDALINYDFLNKTELSALLKSLLAMILGNCYINKIAETGCQLGYKYLYFSWGYKKGKITHIKLLSDNYKVDSVLQIQIYP